MKKGQISFEDSILTAIYRQNFSPDGFVLHEFIIKSLGYVSSFPLKVVPNKIAVLLNGKGER